MLQIAMCLILLWPLFLTIDQCRKVLKGDFTTFLSGTLLKIKLSKSLIIIISFMLSLIIILAMVAIMLAKPI